MSSPETDWVDGIIPPARYWRVRRVFLGRYDGAFYDSADDCFAANRVCESFYRKYPTDRDGNYTPLTIPKPADPADVCLCYPCHLDADSDPHDDGVRDAGDGGGADTGGGPGAPALPSDDGNARDAEGVLLGAHDANATADPGVPDVRNPDPIRVLPEGELT